MRTYRCTVRCQWRRQLWKIGETVECGGGETPPSAFFELQGEEMKEEVTEIEESPRRGRKKREEEEKNDDGPGGRE